MLIVSSIQILNFDNFGWMDWRVEEVTWAAFNRALVTLWEPVYRFVDIFDFLLISQGQQWHSNN